MAQIMRSRFRSPSYFVLAFLILLALYQRCSQSHYTWLLKNQYETDSAGDDRVYHDLSLSDHECRHAFPDLTKQIDDEVARGPYELPFRNGVVLQARIENNQLFIVRTPRKGELSQTMRHRQLSTLHQLHRSLLTSPSSLPNSTLTFSSHDVPPDSTLSFARPTRSVSGKRILPIPHFSFWSWPLPFVGSITSASAAIDRIEEEYSFSSKNPRAVWRGTSWFNNGAGANPRGRQELLTGARGREWADVQALEWSSGSETATNAIRIEDFCRHKYIIHTEGIGYSGRLQFHQLCASVILSPPLEWMQHTSHLIRPVFSSTLLGTGDGNTFHRARQAWPGEYDATEEANMVFVKADWSDLEATVSWLESHQEVAASIARRQRDTYYGKGFLSPAAEACYWRAAVRGWSEIAKPTGQGWETKGVPFEEFITGREDGKEYVVG